jgi:glycerophosphoryl diester phosphodiesterase
LISTEFDREGHRGCRGLMPENTWPAMKKALDLGVTTLELDVVVSRDKKVVVSHEPWFNSEITTKPDGSFVLPEEEMTLNIYLMDYAEVVQFDVGMKPHPRFHYQEKLKVFKPTLDNLIGEVEEDVSQTGRSLPFYNIEIKSDPRGDGIYHPGPEEFAELVMHVIKKRRIENRVMIQSFDFRPLRYLHHIYPNIKIGMLVENNRSLRENLENLKFIPYTYNPDFKLLNAEDINFCHQNNMKVIPWTVNSVEEMEKLITMGVDGIITDYPNLFKQVFASGK